jgi:hypothetical protein
MRMWSLAGTVERLSRRLPPALVPEPARARARRIAGRLPAALTDCVYFERWLGGGAARVDLIVRIDADRAGSLVSGPAALDEALLAHPAWRAVADFIRAWTAPESPLSAQVEAIWLEFDLPAGDPDAETPIPRVFVDFARDTYAHAAPEARAHVVQEALRPLVGEDFARGARARVRSSLERLDPGVVIPYVGLAPGGSETTLRLCVKGLRRHGVARALDALVWPGDTRELEALVLGPLGQGRDDGDRGVSVLHVDLVPDVAPRIGLEYAFARASQLEGRLEETAFLDHLVARGWCGAEVRGLLLVWPGRDVEMLPHDIWPTRVSRRLSHVKLTCAGRAAIEAKAYLCAVLEPMTGGTLIGSRPWTPSTAPARQPGAIE